MTKDRYSICLQELTRSETKRMQELYSSKYILGCLLFLGTYIKKNYRNAYTLQLIERENTGVLFVRINLQNDGRPFCTKPEEMNLDKYGYIPEFVYKKEGEK